LKEMVTTLLLIDVQKDFHPGGSLAIPTAALDAERISAFITTHCDKIDRIVATLDSHHKLHIAHPFFWSNARGEHPTPFTVISTADLEVGKWKPRSDLQLDRFPLDPDVFEGAGDLMSDDGSLNLDKYVVEYTKRLEAKGRFQLCIWPEHCLIATQGHTTVDIVRDAMEHWCNATGGTIEFILKGQHLLTEMYSALQAEVPVSKETAWNESLQASLLQSDQLLVCGQALSHCVNYTMRDIVSHWPEDELGKIILLTDCASAVPGFESASEACKEDMMNFGVQLKTADEIF
jgi:nicotinamidase/pyrazinamidase